MTLKELLFIKKDLKDNEALVVLMSNKHLITFSNCNRLGGICCNSPDFNANDEVKAFNIISCIEQYGMINLSKIQRTIGVD